MDMDQPADRATRFYRHVIAHPYWVMGVFAVITLLAASQLPRIRLQTDLRELLPVDKTYADDERIRETFNIHDSIFVALVQEPTVINVPAMEFMHELVQRIEGLDGVYRVRSVFNQDNIEKTSAGIASTPLIRHVDEQSVERLKERLRNFKALIGVLVSEDQSCLAMIVDVKSGTDMSALVHAIQDAAENGPSRPAGVRVYLAGMPVNEGALGDYVMRDLNLMLPVVFLVVMLTLYLSYRSFTLVGVALVEVLVVDVVTLGLMGFLGVPLHMVHGTMPVVLMALAVADEIHIFDGYFAERAAFDGDNRASILRTMRVMWKPVTLTSVTTALAFLSFLTSTMHPFRTYGVFTAVGVMVAMAFSLLVTPAVLGLRPARSRVRVSGGATSRWLGALGGFMARRRRMFAVAIALIIVVAGLGASRVYVQDSWMDNFDKSSPVRQAFEMVRQKLYGPMLLYLEVDTGHPDGIKDPDFLRRLGALQDDMATVPMVGGTLSVEQILQQANKVFTGNDEPPTKAGASAFFLINLEGHSYDDLWCYPYQKCVVMIFCRTDDYATGKANYNGLRKMVVDRLPDSKASYGGDFALSYHWVGLLLSNFVRSFIASGIMVFLAVLAFSRSLRFSIFTITPILLAVLLNFGAMGFGGIPFGVATSMFSAIILGIGIDYAIHLVSKMERVPAGLGREETVAAAFASTGRAILWDALVVLAGFLILLLSRMPPNRTLGLMVSLGIAVSLVATYLVLPVLWSPGRRKGKE